MSANNFAPGPYVHHKGGVYAALYLARMSEHCSEYAVVYQSLATAEVWVRPFERALLEGDDCWCDLVVWSDGVTRQRFVALSEETRGLQR